jgi:hypothetical protein
MKHIIYLLVLISSLALTSCAHYYYAPNTANVPLISEKNEVRVTGAYAAGRESQFEGGELQAAYGITNHLGVQLNGFSAGRTENTGDYDESGKGIYAEAAAGYFTKFKGSNKWIAELYGGIGKGSVTNDYGLGDHSKVGITKLYLQPAIGFKSKNFEIAVTPKISYIHWKVKDAMLITNHAPDINLDLDHIRQNPGHLAFEPALIIRGGLKNVKIQFAWSFTNLDKNSQSSGLAETENASVGLSVNF